MQDNLALFNVAAHTDLSRLNPEQVALLNLTCELAADQIHHFRWSIRSMYTCDHFDPANILRWGLDAGIFQGEEALIYKAIDTLEDRPEFLTAKEVAKRLELADGACPMCGFKITFYGAGRHKPGMSDTAMRCSHFVYDSVHDPEQTVRRAKSWKSGRWPYSWGERDADDDGRAIERKSDLAVHCTGCRRHSAETLLTRRLLTALTDFIEAARDEKYHALGSSPTSALEGKGEKTWLTLRSLVQKLLDEEHCEFRLNDAGLKLYSKGLQVSYSNRGDVTFRVYVGGDQAKDYEAFVTFANQRLHELEIADVKSNGRMLVCEAVA